MTDFIITFYISNLFLAGIILILIIAKKLLAHTLSTRMQYLLWVFMFVLLAAPFLPIPNLTSVWSFSPDTFSDIQTTTTQTISSAATHTDWLNDFSLSISRESPSWIESLLWGIWISGIGCMIFFLIRSRKQLQTLKDSGYLIRDSEILALYKACLEEANIRKNIPLYGTDKFPSPVITDILHPRIYLPTHLVKDYHASELRYMLLHELQHYKYKDNLIQLCANFIHTLYWFNPCIWYAMKEMRIERELACDTAVLAMLDKSEYHTYGHTLINFSEKVSFSFMPFAAGISSDMKQMKKRILTIANYQTPSVLQKIKGHIIFMFAAVLLLSMAPELSIMASDFGHYDWDSSKEKITYLDLSDYYQQYDGCFVLYDVQKDSWCSITKSRH